METTEYLRPRATRCSNTQSRSIHHTTILMSTRSNHITELLLQSGNDLFVTSIHLRQFRDCEFNTFVNNFIIPKRLSSQTYNERMSLQNGLNLFLQFFSVVRVCRETHFREELNGLRFKWTWWGSQNFVVVITNTSTRCFSSLLLLCYPLLLFPFLLLLCNWFWTQTVIYPFLCDFVRILSLHKLLLRNSSNPYCTNKLRHILESYLHVRSHTHFIFHQFYTLNCWIHSRNIPSSLPFIKMFPNRSNCLDDTMNTNLHFLWSTSSNPQYDPFHIHY